MVVVSTIVSVYYNTIITWVLYYLGKSFTSELPWSDCDNWWNTPLCDEHVNVNGTNVTMSDVNGTQYVMYVPGQLERLQLLREEMNLGENDTLKTRTPAEEFWQ